MISHKFKCIFIHQRKCAGSSIIDTFGFKISDPEWHVMNDGVVSPEYVSDTSGYFRFAVARNPWDRFVSGWKYLAATRDRSLRDVLTNLPQVGKDYRHLTRPQHTTLFDQNGRLISTISSVSNGSSRTSTPCVRSSASPGESYLMSIKATGRTTRNILTKSAGNFSCATLPKTLNCSVISIERG